MNPKTEQKTEIGEIPIKTVNGIVLANDAYHCRAVDLWPTGVAEMKPEWADPIKRYLKAFCRPVRTIADEIRCVACDRQVTGHHVSLQDFRTKSGLTYAPDGTMEGRCTGCGYPCRLLHEIFMPNDGPLLVRLVGFPLFYHPLATQMTN